ncbi:MAG: type I methionyl aminopeptidase [Enterobacteriaceae bacterium]|nr:type I methionyl aminopeptidase [Enterobacteriaceae bacterium]
MQIYIKNESEIKKIATACKLATNVLEMIESYIKKNITTNEINEICHEYIINDLKAIPASLNYHGFPKSICTSLNNQVCHGIPNNKKLKTGDILNIDVTIMKNGYFGDTSKMFIIDTPDIKAKKLVETCKECLYMAIKKLKPGEYFNIIGEIIEDHANSKGYSVVKEYCGHGIGKFLHEDPLILHYKNTPNKLKMQSGMIFTIEPMINAGKEHVRLLNDNWTVVTKDNSLSAQWEHTILITENSYEVLTLRKEEKI